MTIDSVSAEKCADTCVFCEEVYFSHAHLGLHGDATDGLGIYECVCSASDHFGHIFGDNHGHCPQLTEKL